MVAASVSSIDSEPVGIAWHTSVNDNAGGGRRIPAQLVEEGAMPDHPNAAIIRRLYESDDSGPWDIVTDDVIWHVIGRDEPSRSYQLGP